MFVPGKEPVEFGDGVLTCRNTFQKFYEQAELKAYLEAHLQVEAIPAGIGTFYLFKDETRRQQFLANRFRRREILPRRRIAGLTLAESREALEPLMGIIADLGRVPDPTDFAGAQAVTVSADRALPYGEVAALLDDIRGAGARKVGLEVARK